MFDQKLLRAIQDIDNSLTYPEQPLFETRLIAMAWEFPDKCDFLFTNIDPRYFKHRYLRALWICSKHLWKNGELDTTNILRVFGDTGFAFRDKCSMSTLEYGAFPIIKNASILDWCRESRAKYMEDRFSENYAAFGLQKAIEIKVLLESEMVIHENDAKSIQMDDQIQEQLEYQKKIKEGGGLEGYRTFSWFDDSCGGLIPNDLITIAARPGGFKTGLAINLALQAVKMNKGLKVAFINLEMPSKQMLPRFVQAYHHVTKAIFQRWDTSKQLEAMNQVFHHKRLISTRAMHLDGKELISVMRKFYDDGFTVFFVDYLQLIRTKQNYGVRDDLRIQEAINHLKEFKDSCDGVHICCLAQLTRGSENKDRPTMADLAGSSYIEAASAMVLINNPLKDKESSAYNGPELMNGTVVKNRHGHVGDIGIVIDKAKMLVLDTKAAQEWSLENER